MTVAVQMGKKSSARINTSYLPFKCRFGALYPSSAQIGSDNFAVFL